VRPRSYSVHLADAIHISDYVSAGPVSPREGPRVCPGACRGPSRSVGECGGRQRHPPCSVRGRRPRATGANGPPLSEGRRDAACRGFHSRRFGLRNLAGCCFALRDIRGTTQADATRRRRMRQGNTLPVSMPSEPFPVMRRIVPLPGYNHRRARRAGGSSFGRYRHSGGPGGTTAHVWVARRGFAIAGVWRAPNSGPRTPGRTD
jgi:hypothetical protein